MRHLEVRDERALRMIRDLPAATLENIGSYSKVHEFVLTTALMRTQRRGAARNRLKGGHPPKTISSRTIEETPSILRPWVIGALLTRVKGGDSAAREALITWSNHRRNKSLRRRVDEWYQFFLCRLQDSLEELMH